MQISGISQSASVSVSSFAINAKNLLSVNRFDKERAEAEEQERKIQENENKRLEDLNKRITGVSESELDADSKEAKIEKLSNQIKQIYENRAARQQLNAEREVERHKQEQEEKLREQEKAAEKREESIPENTEDALVREDISGMVKLAVSAEGMQMHKQTKALRQAEATQLENDIENDMGIQQIEYDVKGGDDFNVGRYLTIKTKMNPGDLPNSFRTRNLEKLHMGIANLNATINSDIRKMNGIREDWADDRNEIALRAENEQPLVKENNDNEKTEAVENADGTAVNNESPAETKTQEQAEPKSQPDDTEQDEE